MKIGSKDNIADVIIRTTNNNNLLMYDIVRLTLSNIETKLSKKKVAPTVQLLLEQKTIDMCRPSTTQYHKKVV